MSADKAAETARGHTALELLLRLRNFQQLAHKNQPTVVLPLEPFDIID
jgi:hypothetical protein